ncbi:MAG: hypothetical protein LKI42_03330 [Bacteroidales bacterium]|jgi:hypothetical protein|nr:hypothetical protein [Bacteroidales bacterium]MCI1785170.1 hypothetical protein [Bacteroidales bacterium]
MSGKISDNESYINLRKDIQGFEAFSKLYKFLKLFGFKNNGLEEVLKKIPEFKNQIKLLSEAPDLFNKYYAKKGWIAYELMNSDLMNKCISLAKENKIGEGEQNLIEYYKSEDLHWLIAGLKNIEAFKIRYLLLLKTYNDFKEERYYSCIPLLLMIIDGATDDIRKENKGFFAAGVNLTAWDSISGHESGLQYIAQIFSKSRKKTTTEKITIPYRNGILHGKDLGYDNIIVAAKLWSTLFAVGSWAKIIIDGKDVAPPPKKELSFKESIVELTKYLNDYRNWQEEKKIRDKELQEWEPRNFKNVDLCNLKSIKNTPENELDIFFQYVYDKKYGLIANQLDPFSRGKKTKNKIAGEVREKFEDIKVLNYKIVSINDDAPAITEIRTNVIALTNNIIMTKPMKFRMIYQDIDGNPLPRSNNKGKWYLLEICLSNFYNFKWINE